MRKILAAIAAVTALASAPAEAAWHVAKSKHFIIYADQRPQALRAFAEKLEKFDAAVRIVRRSEDPPIGDGLRLTVYVLDDMSDVSHLAVGKASDIAGFYIPRASGSVAFVPKKAGEEDGFISADTVFFHEYAHHLMFENLDGAYPGWVTEGFAELFSTPEFTRSGEVQIGRPALHRVPGLMLLGKPNLTEMLAGTPKMKNSEDRERLYGRGWLLTHYLDFAPSRRGQHAKYLLGIRNGMTPLAAAQAAFGDINALDRELDRYLDGNSFRYLDVKSPLLAQAAASVSVRQLTRGEAAIMPVRMRSHRGVSKKTAPQVAAQARKIAHSAPDDVFVQTTLAEAEYDVGNYPAAIAAADRALAIDPQNSPALVYKGRALMEQARQAPDKADWEKVRGYFMQANRVDREDPEPLMLFYESFGAAGETATPNAIEGLLYAQLIAPQDRGLRIMAASELLNSKRFREAKSLLATLVFDTHAGEKLRANARSAIAAIDGGNGAQALRILGSTPDEEGDGA